MMAGILAESWSLIFLGMTALCFILGSYAAFIPKCAAVRRRMLEMAWWVPSIEMSRGSLIPDAPFPLRIYIRNKADYSLGWARIRAIKSRSVIMETEPPPLRLRGSSETGAVCSLKATAAGHPFLHGATMSITDILGIFEMEAFFSTSLELRVFPRLSIRPLRSIRGSLVGAPHQRTGAHRRRLTGFGGELKEIREHRPGDSFKQIAWAPTARFRKLMVTEHESEILMNHHLILDISSTMRDREPGKSKLDYGVDFCAGFAKEALDGGDRVGLMTVDSRILNHVKISEGRKQLFRIVEQLMEAHHVIDEDLTDLTDAELVECTALYLMYQEGVDARIKHLPPPESNLWKYIVTGPSGGVFDIRILDGWAQAVLNNLQANPGKTPKWLKNRQGPPAKDPRMAGLRLICRLRGIDIPYRTGFLRERKTSGMAEAVRFVASAHRMHHIVLVSDLMGFDVRGPMKAALQFAMKRGHRITAFCPFAPMLWSDFRGQNEKLFFRIFAKDEMHSLSPVFFELAKLGVRVKVGSPEKPVETPRGGSTDLKTRKKNPVSGLMF